MFEAVVQVEAAALQFLPQEEASRGYYERTDGRRVPHRQLEAEVRAIGGSEQTSGAIFAFPYTFQASYYKFQGVPPVFRVRQPIKK